MFQKTVAEKIKTNFVFNNFFQNCAVYKIMWKNIVQRDRQHTPRGLQIHFHVAFPCNSGCMNAPVLRSTYIASLVFRIQMQTRRKVIHNRII